MIGLYVDNMLLFGKKEYFKPDADGVAPVLVLVSKTMTVKVFDVPALLGRDKQQVDVMVNDATVSRKHLLIGTYEGKYTATDQGSTVGTVINGEQLEAGYPYYLSEGDKVEIGKLKFVCHINKEKAGKKISLPSLLKKDTSADTSEMKKSDLNEAMDAAEKEKAAAALASGEPAAEKQDDKDPVVQLMKDAEQEVKAEPVINLMPEPEPEEPEDEETEEEPEDEGFDEEPKDEGFDEEPKNEGVEEEPESEGSEEKSEEKSEGPEVEDFDGKENDSEDKPELDTPSAEPEESAGSISVSEIEKDMNTDPISELEGMGLDFDGGKPKFVYYSGHTAVETFEITTTPFVIGRARSDYAPGAAGVSRRHCYIDKTGSTYYITDLESTNGVWINGRKIKPYNRTALVNGDIIGIGDRVYKYEQTI